MGAVKLMLSEKQLKEREPHNSRLFIDLCENIHIHFREYRFVFSLPEYFEFIDIVGKSTVDVRNYLAQNPDYEEQKYKTTLMVAGGLARQLKFLENSPSPNESKYFNNSLRIELQEEYVTDEIHVHYRDFRLSLDRENFKDIAAAFTEAHARLVDFESQNSYTREAHRDRTIDSWAQESSISQSDTRVMGSREILLTDIRSNWYSNIAVDWNPDPRVIDALRAALRSHSLIAPVVVSQEESNAPYVIVDGHHRVRAALEEGLESITCVVLKDTRFDDTKLLREAEEKLKQFDKETNQKYRMSEFFRNYIAHSLNSYYRDQFHRVVKQPNLGYRFLKRSKSFLMKLPLPIGARNAIAGLSGSKKYWR